MGNEITTLSPQDEAAFQQWVVANRAAPGVGNHDSPDSHYDMRGFFNDKKALATWRPGDHFPDTYKQHGHPSFSKQSQYSSGPSDGGMWIGDNDTYLAQPKMAVSHDPLQAALIQRMVR